MTSLGRLMVGALFLLGVSLFLLVSCTVKADSLPVSDTDLAEDVDIQILSTNLANGATLGEWGLSALVKVDGHCILFDAGRHPQTVVKNAVALGVDLTCVETMVLSHFHFDHTGGLHALLGAIRKDDPNRVITTYVAKGFFASRQIDTSNPTGAAMQRAFGTTHWNFMRAQRTELEALGMAFVEIDEATQIRKGVWATGPIERQHPEELYPTWSRLETSSGGTEVDFVPDSQGLVVKTANGPIIMLGCGHSGAVNLVSQVLEDIQPMPPLALMGGLHLFNASDDVLDWTATELREFGVQHLMAGHCTGIYPMQFLQNRMGLDRRTAVIGAVGARFELGHGIHPTPIAR